MGCRFVCLLRKEIAASANSSLEIFAANNPLNPVANQTYSTLVQFKPGYLKPI